MNKLVTAIVILFFATCAQAAHLHREKDYQAAWCACSAGVTEYVLDDGARVDCLTDEYAIEFDFAPKWAEAVGQALYYAEKTGRQPAIVLILEDPDRDARYLERLWVVTEKYCITVWVMTPDELGDGN